MNLPKLFHQIAKFVRAKLQAEDFSTTVLTLKSEKLIVKFGMDTEHPARIQNIRGKFHENQLLLFEKLQPVSQINKQTKK